MHTKFGKVKVGMNFRNVHTKETFEVVEIDYVANHPHGISVVVFNDGSRLNKKSLEPHYELINQSIILGV